VVDGEADVTNREDRGDSVEGHGERLGVGGSLPFTSAQEPLRSATSQNPEETCRSST
jgi:hypothetical protein